MADKMMKRVGDSKREIMEAKRRKIMQVLKGGGDNTEEEMEEKVKEGERTKKELMKELDAVQALLSSTLISKDQQIAHLERQLKSGSDSKRLVDKNREIEALVVENQKFSSALDGAKNIWIKFESEMKAKDCELKDAMQELDGAKRVVKKLTTEVELKSAQLERNLEKYKVEAKEKDNELKAREGELEEMRIEIRESQEQNTRILMEIRDRLTNPNPTPPNRDDSLDILSSPPATNSGVINNNLASPMPPDETRAKRMQRQRAMSKITAVAQEKSLPDTDTDEDT